MKSRWLIGVVLVLGASVFATPASATIPVYITADCEGYEIVIQGRHWICWDFYYTFYLEEMGGATIPVSGQFEVCPDENKDVYVKYIGSWGMDLCGTYKVSADYVFKNIWYPDMTGTWGPFVLECPCGNGEGTGTPGYWMNHPEAWPVDEIKIGCVVYTKADAIAHMMASVSGDKTFTMFPALVAAKLNILIGTDPSCIADVIADADAWMCLYGPVGSGVAGSSMAWELGEPLYEMLDAYNNGELCAPSRDSLEEEEEEEDD
jgi:hypothetical protein